MSEAQEFIVTFASIYTAAMVTFIYIRFVVGGRK